MKQFLYDRYGNPVGYIYDNFIHTLHGKAIGQVRETHVYKLTGEYVGELHDSMVVDMDIGDEGNIGHSGYPGNPGFFGIPAKRPSSESEYNDVFRKLLDNVDAFEAVDKYKDRIL